MNDCPALLIAAGWGLEEVLRIIVIVVFGLIYLFNHLVGGAKAQKRRPARPAQPRPEGRPEVQDEVAEFLKRATEKRPAAKRAEGRGQSPRRPIPAESVEARLETPSTSRWPQTVQPHVDSLDLAQRAEQLSHVNQTEAAFQAHMQTLEHSVGRIQEAVTDAALPAQTPRDDKSHAAATPAGELFAALLADAQSLRQAIVLNEIIRRPEERW
jgi:hypothetical protein